MTRLEKIFSCKLLCCKGLSVVFDKKEVLGSPSHKMRQLHNYIMCNYVIPYFLTFLLSYFFTYLLISYIYYIYIK